MDTVRAFHELEQEYTPPPPRIFTTADPTDWRTRAARKKPHVFAEGLACGGMGLVVGPGGGSKTTALLQASVGLTLGRCTLQGFTPEERGDVLFITAEDDEDSNFARVLAMVEAGMISDAEADWALDTGALELLCQQPAPLLEFTISGAPVVSSAFEELAAMAEAKRYQLIVLDPFASYCGLNDENSNTAMQAAAGCAITLAQLTGGAVLYIHHSNKHGERGGDITQNTARGGSALSCASRWGGLMRPWCEKDAKDNGIPTERAGEFVEFINTKNSYKPLRGGRQLFRRAEAGLLVPASVQAIAGADVLTSIIAELTEHPVNLTQHEIVHSETTWAKGFRAGVNKRTGREVTRKALEAAIEEGVFSEHLERQKVKTAGAPRHEVHIKGPTYPTYATD